MSQNLYHVNNILLIDPAIAPLEPGKYSEDLEVGQVGVFSAESHLSIDGTAAQDARRFYIRVGVGDCAGNKIGSKQSSNFEISRADVIAYNFRCFTPYRAQVWELTKLNPSCETPYSLRLEVTSNDTMSWQGFKPKVLSIPAVTACCESCGCPSGDCADLAIKLAKNLAVSSEGCLTVRLFPEANATECNADGTAVAGAAVNADGEIDPMDDAAINAWLDANPPVDGVRPACLGIRTYGNAQGLAAFCGIPFNRQSQNLYNNVPKAPIYKLLPGENFGCMGMFCEVQEAIEPEVTCDDVSTEQYWSAGYEESGPYRQLVSGAVLSGSPSNGPCGCTDGYHTVDLTYYSPYHDGWRESDNMPNHTRLAIKCAAGVEDAFAVLEILDNILSSERHSAGFGPLYDDAQSCPACDVPNKTNEAFGNNPDVGDTDGDGTNDTPPQPTNDGDGLTV